jgi:nucleotide-binding universal stress UspA family protein
MVKKIQLLVDSSPDLDVTAIRAVSVASHLDAVIVATEIRDTRRFDSYRKSETAKQAFRRKLESIGDLAADRGVEICDEKSSKAVLDQSKDILKVAGHVHPNVVVSSALDGARRVGLSDRASELFKYSKHNLLLVKNPQHDANDFQNILVSADSPFDISGYTADFAERYRAKLTAVKVVDLEEGLVKERPVYLSEVSSPAPGMPRRQLGDTVKTSETLLTKMKESGIRRGQAMADAVADVAHDRGVEVETKVLIGRRDDELAKFSKQQQIDLLMLGSNRENLIKRLMHKTAPESIARKVDSSVFAVRKVA